METTMSIEIPKLASCPKCGEREKIISELHPGTAFVRCDACKHIGPEFMPMSGMLAQQSHVLLAAVVDAWNNLPR